MAQQAGAEDARLDFFKHQGNNLFLGLSTVKKIDNASVVPYRVGGEAAASHLFDASLLNYRDHPTTYNKSLLFFSGMDFLWYSFWTLYLQDDQDPSYDPVGISQETGLPAHAILGMAAFQTALNTYRVNSGSDLLVPYFDLDRTRAEMGVRIQF